MKRSEIVAIIYGFMLLASTVAEIIVLILIKKIDNGCGNVLYYLLYVFVTGQICWNVLNVVLIKLWSTTGNSIFDFFKVRLYNKCSFILKIILIIYGMINCGSIFYMGFINNCQYNKFDIFFIIHWTTSVLPFLYYIICGIIFTFLVKVNDNDTGIEQSLCYKYEEIEYV